MKNKLIFSRPMSPGEQRGKVTPTPKPQTQQQPTAQPTPKK